MQIKLIKSLLIICFAFAPCVSWSGASDWFAGNCKQITDKNGYSARMNDLRQKPEFKNAKFYKNLCSGGKAATGTSVCVKKFSNSQVHDMGQAIRIAKDYILESGSAPITCHNDYWSCKDNDDHILCATADNKEHYEFIFDDITEKKDEKYKHGIANSYCKIFFGDDSSIDKTWYQGMFEPHSKEMDPNDMLACWAPDSYQRDLIWDRCLEFNQYVHTSFGYYVMPDTYMCRIDFRTHKCADSYQYDFKTLQVDLNSDLVAWLGAHVQKQRGQTINEFKCDLAPRTCKTGELTNPDDDVLSCYADGEEIWIRFDDLSETKSKWIKASKDALECIDANGVFDGRRCQGISRAECDKLKTDKGIDIDWDSDLQACVLKSANSVANIKRATEVASTVGVAAVITGATIATGGSTVVVLLAVGATATATGSQVIISEERDRVAQFTSELLACGPKPKSHKAERNCIKEKLTWFIDHGSNYMNNLTPSQIDAVDKALARKLGALKMDNQDEQDLLAAFDKSKDKDLIDRCTGDALQAGKCVFDAASIILDFLPVTSLAMKAPEALGTFALKLGKKLPNTSKTLLKLRTSSKIIKEGLRTMEKFDTMNDIATGVSGAGAI